MQLYKAPLPGGGAIFWELAVAFSPRRSETAENILAADEVEAPGGGDGKARGRKGRGRIYSELIRVWNIVLSFAEQKKVVKKIVSSYRRGEHCIVQVSIFIVMWL